MELILYFKANFTKILLILLVFSLFFPIRHVFLSPTAYGTGAYSDFTSFSLYLSDILFFILVFAKCRALKFNDFNKAVLFSLPILMAASFFVGDPANRSLSLFFWLKAAELALLFFIFKNALGKSEIRIFWASFLTIGAIQAVIALIQFTLQHSLGIGRLGESHVAVDILGVAKISLNNGRFIRPYGTFPHPNLLSAFLFTAIIGIQYLLFHVEQKKWRILRSIGSFALILGLFLTFSRAALLALAVALVLMFGVILLKLGLRKKILRQMSLLVVSLGVSGLLLAPFLAARAIVSDTAAKERAFYSQIGQKIIQKNWLFGVGPGTSVLHMKQYSPIALQPWEIQPVHNYFLLAAADLGIPSALILVAIFLYYLIQLIKTAYRSAARDDRFVYRTSLLAIFSGFIILMMFDHYFYTIQQTQFLFWIVIGLIAREVSRGQESLPAQTDQVKLDS